MNPEYWRYILQIKEQGSISKAASYSFVSQPYLSNILQNMEEELGFNLFYRSRSGATPTPEGIAVLEKAAVYLSHYEEFESYCDSVVEDTFRIKVATVPFCYAEHAIARQMRKHHQPQTSVRLAEFHPFLLPKEVLDGSFRVGFMSYNTYFHAEVESTMKSKQLEFVELGRLTPEVLISRDHPALEAIRGDFSLLEKETIILQTVLLADADNLHRLFKNTELQLPKNNRVMTDYSTLMYFLATQSGFTITPHGVFYRPILEKENIEALPIAELENTIRLGYVYNTSYELTDSLQELIDTWKTVVTQELGDLLVISE